MRKAILFLWLLLPAVAAAYHYGPGQDRIRSDRAAGAIERAQAAAREARDLTGTSPDQAGDAAARARWADAEQAYSEALALLPADQLQEARELRLERAKAQMFTGKLPEARGDLEVLLDELTADSTVAPELVADTRGALASAQYYSTWLMRLEGAPREEWEPEIEAARQNYKLLAEQAEQPGQSTGRAGIDAGLAATQAKENLEASIRLARLELADLQGLPLPSQ